MTELAIFEVVENGETRRFAIRSNCHTAEVLQALIRNGEHGTTAVEVSSWLLRMSEYIRRLRAHHGLQIETVREHHVDPWGAQSWHGRYILKSNVCRITHDMEAA